MKQPLVIILTFICLGFALIYFLFVSTENSYDEATSTIRTTAVDSLNEGYAVFWPSKNAYFRIKNRSWEYSSNYLNIPFQPVATDEIIKELNDRYNQSAFLLSEMQSELPSQQKIVNPEPTTPDNSPSGKTDISYKNNKYRIAKEVLTDKGLEHTNGDHYRFLNQSKWELKRIGSKQWSPVEEKDINYFLSVNAKKIEKVNPPPPGPIALTGIALNKTSLNNLTVGGTAQLSVTFTPVNATNKTAKWTSGNSSVASVSSAGKITAINPGKTTITVSSGSFTKTCEVTVVKAGVDEDIPDMTFDEKHALEPWFNFPRKKPKEAWTILSREKKIEIINSLTPKIRSKQGRGYLQILNRSL